MIETFDFDSMKEYIELMHDAEFTVMDLHNVTDGKCDCSNPYCTNLYKHPVKQAWQNLPKFDDTLLENYFINKLFHKSYGIVLDDTTLIVDFDPRNGANALNELNAMVGVDLEAASMFVVKTGGGGLHLYFKKDPAMKIQKNLREIKGIDFLSKGSFVIGVGSFHKSGYMYELPNAKKSNPDRIQEAPEALMNLIERIDVIATSSYESGSSDIDELAEALDYVPNDSNHDYDYWLSIGMALSFETQNNVSGFDLWCKWSLKSDKHDEDQMALKWNSFASGAHSTKQFTAGTIFKFAKDNGWEQDFSKVIDISAFIDTVERGNKVVYIKPDSVDPDQKEMQMDNMPPEIKMVSGVLGDIVTYTLETAKYPLVMPSITGALAMTSLILGRDFLTDYENYSNMYYMTIAETGAGKEHPVHVAEKILESMSMNHLLKREVTSKAAIVTELYDQPRLLFTKDEIAHWMQTVGSKNASENKISEVKTWMELYSKANSTFQSDSYANLREIMAKNIEERADSSVLIQKPSVTLLGQTTPQKLGEAMTKMMIQDGFLNRWVISFAQEGDQKMNKDAKPRPVPQSIMSWVETIERRVKHHNHGEPTSNRNIFDTPVKPITLKFTDEANVLLDKYEDRILVRKKELRTVALELMIVRNREKAMRLALIIELSKEPYAEVISPESVSWAIKYIDFTFEQMIKYIEFEMVVSSVDQLNKDAMKLIDSFGDKGITRTELMRKHPFSTNDKRKMADVLDYLINATDEVIEFLEEPTKKGGRSKRRYYSAKFAKMPDML